MFPLLGTEDFLSLICASSVLSYMLMHANIPLQALNDVQLRTYRLGVDKKEPLFGLKHDLKVQSTRGHPGPVHLVSRL